MTITETKNAIIIYLLKHPEVTVLSLKDISNLNIGPDSDETSVSFLAAISELESIGVFKKQALGENATNFFWVLANPLDKQDKSIDVSYEIIDAAAKTIEQYMKASGQKDNKVDRTNFSENEIGMLLYIISDILNNNKEEK